MKAHVILCVHLYEGNEIPEEFKPKDSLNSQALKAEIVKIGQYLYWGYDCNIVDGMYSIHQVEILINYSNIHQAEPEYYPQVIKFREWLTSGDEPRGYARIIGMRIGDKLIAQGFEKE